LRESKCPSLVVWEILNALYRTRMERENQDLTLQRIRAQAAENRTTVLESVA